MDMPYPPSLRPRRGLLAMSYALLQCIRRPRRSAKLTFEVLVLFLVLFEPVRAAVIPIELALRPDFKLNAKSTEVAHKRVASEKTKHIQVTHSTIDWVLQKPKDWAENRWEKALPTLEAARIRILGAKKSGRLTEEKQPDGTVTLKRRDDGGPALGDEQLIMLAEGYDLTAHLRTISTHVAAAGGVPFADYIPWDPKPDGGLPQPPSSPPAKSDPKADPGYTGYPGFPGYAPCPGFPAQQYGPSVVAPEIGVSGTTPDGKKLDWYPGTPQWEGGPPYEPGMPGAPDYPGNSYAGPNPSEDADADNDDGFDLTFPHGYPLYGTSGAPGAGLNYYITPQVPESVVRISYPEYDGFMGAPDPSVPGSPGETPPEDSPPEDDPSDGNPPDDGSPDGNPPDDTPPDDSPSDGTPAPIPTNPDEDPDNNPPNMPDPHAPGGKFYPPDSSGSYIGYYRPTYSGPPGGSTLTVDGTDAAQNLRLVEVFPELMMYILGDIDMPGSYTDYLRNVPGVFDIASMDQFMIAVIKEEVKVVEQSLAVFEHIGNEVVTIQSRAPSEIMKLVGAPYHLGVTSNRTWTSTGPGSNAVYRSREADTSNVNLYLVDTGINPSHVAFTGRASSLDPKIPGLGKLDDNGHGTHVAGLAAGVGFGQAIHSKIYAVKVFDGDGNAYAKDIIRGIMTVIKHHKTQKGKKGVLNLSFQGQANAAVDRVVRQARRAGLAVVTAAGNQHQAVQLSSPARLRSVITVGASTRNGEFWAKSNSGRGVDIIAPGVDIMSTWIGSTTRGSTLSGTSMAAPQVAGLMAYYWALHPHLDSRQIGKFVKENASTGRLKKLPMGQKDRLLYNCVDLDCYLERKDSPFIRIERRIDRLSV